MDHVAILDKKRKLLDKIIAGEKTIESRWTKHRRLPYGCIARGDTIYFRDSGRPITVRATVADVVTFDDLTPQKVLAILREYGGRIGVDVSYASKLSGKRYCVLMFLEDVRTIEPFFVDKTGFGNATAWMTVNDIKNVRTHLKKSS